MSSAIHPTITNTLYDGPLVCRNQLRYKSLGRNVSLFQPNMRKIKHSQLGSFEVDTVVKILCSYWGEFNLDNKVDEWVF